ncbi:MAG: Endonuclease/exonuclease/phosphatase [Parcubacteria group bacterium Gr01-1014_18]|nr:MAG: Endonuclease/exonuclease/phosphatase [Parcubacteria group bacterium Greene0416_36]TSC81079.1 MAG: Endonuclease/exonuclease/phosphatase [Parcubacteria group bacterium Gr01-1014_18]TSC98813.1 MAG: Endonuclease/exonuclease/phosphatase [Parcubacteria group bacterium Greene1014_20]TSD06707.1 MAG: Endonuclease/exonuclease/phosphatase [Parcubacteria group bacterium Greene0714_2]
MTQLKIIYFNIWGGKKRTQLVEWIRKEKLTCNIFCFQEVLSSPQPIDHESGHDYDSLGWLQRELEGFTCFYEPFLEGVDREKLGDREHWIGNATFVRDFDVLSNGAVWVFGQKNKWQKTVQTIPRNLQFLHLESSFGERFSVVNFHGVWDPSGKGDTDARIIQSQRILRFLAVIRDPFVLGGDFNLSPDTQSFKAIREGTIDLIDEYQIKSTRSALYKRPGRGLFADYVLLSAGLSSRFEVVKFEVPQDLLISDHLPLITELKIVE